MPTAVPTLVPTINPTAAPSFLPTTTPLDLSALSALYIGTKGSSWLSAKNWLSGNHPCLSNHTWYGIECGGDATNNSVTGVRLAANNLAEGTIPTQVGFLSKLSSSFDVGSNLLNGTLPSELGAFRKLAGSFDVRSNRFDGALPTELAELASLTGRFDARSNAFTSTLPPAFGSLSAVRRLHLDNNANLCGDLPDQLLSANNNTTNFTRAGTALGTNCYFLEEEGRALSALYASSGGASAWSRRAGWMSGYACTNGWYGVSCGAGGAQVRRLNLEFNSLSGYIPTELGMLSVLTSHFNLASNGLSKSIPSELGALTRLRRVFDISSNSLISTIPSQLGNLATNLTRDFDLSSNQLCGTVPAEVGSLSSSMASSDTYEVTGGNYIGETPCSSVSALVALYDSAGGAWTTVTNWQYWKVNDPCDVDGAGAVWKGVSCASNAVVGLERTFQNLMGTLPTELGHLTSITGGLELQSNYLTGTVPSEFGRMRLLSSSFRLDVNNLTSSLPTQLGNWTTFTEDFDLTDNSFCGSIPSEMAHLSSSVVDSTTWTVQSGNHFGPTPCPVLDALMLLYEQNGGSSQWTSNDNWMLLDPCTYAWDNVVCSSGVVKSLPMKLNKLTGNLPTEIAKITALSTATFTRNKLTGTLPTEVMFFF
jgi:hypothetical protein